ncbi:MAG: type VI secretion system lipoprotein TssJ [Rhodospirillaceae bacterium]|nr:type VI secretion system lipoprotein TssJ [Rhodospirillaceae bacterium]MCA8933771.1 type VI secretion system lipoprotein TssJ [Rhodospirillaceae bacterium]
MTAFASAILRSGVSARRGLGFMAAAFAALLALAACQTVPPPPAPTVVNVSLAADATINPELSGLPAPVLVRVYELTSASEFQQADFFQLLERDQETLGAAMVGREELTLSPGGSDSMTLNFGPESRYVGVMVAFRDIDNALWRAVTSVPQNATSAVAVSLSGLTVQIGGAGIVAPAS